MTEFGKRGRRNKEDQETYQPPQQQPEPSSSEHDIELACSDCGAPFVFTVGEQQFFRERIGPEYRVPKRCKECRAVKKQNKPRT